MFDPTPEELELVADILLFTDTKESRILPTEIAIDVFERSDLSREELREIWRLADKDRNGMLTSKELAVALRLIGWVQVGETLSAHLIELRE
jgi:Ca2+-binding EF-hand superfamily protein